MDELHGRQKIIAQLVEARLEQGVSQAELARRVGTQRSNICLLYTSLSVLSMAGGGALPHRG